MRTLQEIDDHVTESFSILDASELDALSAELAVIGSDEALALRAIVMGQAAYRREDVDSAMAASEDAIARYLALNDLHGMARATLNQGRVFHYLGDKSTARSRYVEAIDYYTQCGNVNRTLRPRVNIGLIDHELGNAESALEILLSCVQQAIDLHDDHALGNSYMGIGSIYLDQDDFGKATEYYRRAIEVYERQGEHHSVGNSLNSLAIIHFYVGDYVAAAELWHQVLEGAIARGWRNGESTTLHNLGNLHDSFGEKEQALQCYERSRQIGIEQQQQQTVLHAEQKIGGLYCDLGRVDEGIALIEGCIRAYQQLGLDDDVVQASTSLAGRLLNLEQNDRVRDLLASIEHIPCSPSLKSSILRVRAELALRDQHPESARDLLLEALTITEQINLAPTSLQIHLDLRNVYKQLNDFDGYIRHNELWTKINEEIKGIKVSQQLATQAAERRIAIERQEHQKYLAVLHSTLPKHIADRVARGEQVQDHCDHAAVLFLDIVGFTTLSGTLHPSELVSLLDTVFGICDAACANHGLTKVKTIGDSYLAFAIPDSSPESLNDNAFAARDVALRTANAALEVLHAVSHIVSPVSSPEGSPAGSPERSPAGSPERSPAGSPERSPAGSPERSPAGSPERSHVSVRIGLHCGALTAGVIGKDRLQYDIWGDTVNVASRMENTCEPGRIHVSEAFAGSLTPLELERGGTEGAGVRYQRGSGTEGAGVRYQCVRRGTIDIKGKGVMTTYWLDPAP